MWECERTSACCFLGISGRKSESRCPRASIVVAWLLSSRWSCLVFKNLSFVVGEVWVQTLSVPFTAVRPWASSWHYASLSFPICRWRITVPTYNPELVRVFLFKILFIFRERGRKWGRKRERNISVWLPLVQAQLGTWPASQACALTGNRTSNLRVCRPALNPLSHASQGQSLKWDISNILGRWQAIQ